VHSPIRRVAPVSGRGTWGQVLSFAISVLGFDQT
jgi:hypothetical protein